MGTEVLGLGTPLAGEVVGEPVWQGGSKCQGRRLLGDQRGRSLYPGQLGSLGGRDLGEPV